jgi:hypothetical protein
MVAINLISAEDKCLFSLHKVVGVVVVVIVWLLDLPLPVQSVPITNNIVS